MGLSAPLTRKCSRQAGWGAELRWRSLAAAPPDRSWRPRLGRRSLRRRARLVDELLERCGAKVCASTGLRPAADAQVLRRAYTSIAESGFHDQSSGLMCSSRSCSAWPSPRAGMPLSRSQQVNRSTH